MSNNSSPAPRRILWRSVVTVLSAAILISAEVFGAAFAGGWALANLVGLGDDRRLRHADRLLRAGRRRDGRLRAQRACASSRSPRRIDASFTMLLRRCHRRRILLRSAALEAPQSACATPSNRLFANCPISHVPVAVCRSVGIRTRGRTAARSEIAMIVRSSDRLSSEHLIGSRRRNRRTPLSTGDAA